MYRQTTITAAFSAFGLPLLLLVCGLLASVAEAQDDKPGLFEVRSAQTELVEGVYLLDARLQYILSSDALAALESGLPLNFAIEIEVIESRRFWVDSTAARLTVQLQLQYHALSQRYLVTSVNSGEQESFATLYSALNNLGRLSGYPVIDEALLHPTRKHRLRIRSMLEFRDFAGPLRALAFWLDDWHLQSEWFTWPLDR